MTDHLRSFPIMHPRIPGKDGVPICIGDRLVFLHPDDNCVEILVEVASLNYDSTDYGEGAPMGWVVTDRLDDTFEFPVDEVLRVDSLGPESWNG